MNLNEALITFGNKTYPKDGNIVILAGGSGSGKGFIISNLLGIEGKIFDVDDLKKWVLKSVGLKHKIKTEFNIDLSYFDLSNPDDVTELHYLISDLELAKKQKIYLFNSVNQLKTKPNIIFDVTLKDLENLYDIHKYSMSLGYEKKNIHVVWVLTDYQTATSNNNDPKRARKVPELVLRSSHEGVSRTLKSIVTMDGLNKYMDGDIWIVFNNRDTTKISTSTNGGSYIKDTTYIKIKKQGQSPTSIDKIEKEIINLINKNVPKGTEW